MGNRKADFTLAVTSYNRAPILNNWLEHHKHLGFPILVVDNGSSDDTFQVAKSHDVRVLRNKHSQGFVDGWITLFENCETSHLVILSDEDNLALSSIPEWEDAAFISTLFHHDDITRGNRSGEVQPNDLFMSAFYLSGLIYETIPARESVKMFSGFEDNFYWQVYPQVATLIFLLAEGLGRWDSHELCVLRDRVPSEPPVASSLLYYSPEGRRTLWHDWQHLIDYAITVKPDLVTVFESMRIQNNMDSWKNC